MPGWSLPVKTVLAQAPDPWVSQGLNMANQAGVGENRSLFALAWLGRILIHLANAKTGKVEY